MNKSTPVSRWNAGEQPRKKAYQKPTLTKLGPYSDTMTSEAAPRTSSTGSVDDGLDHVAKRRTRVLLVDDEKLMLQILRDDLEECGFQVATAANGGDAFRLVPEFNPDVVVMDVIMPGENGYRVCRALKELANHGMDAAPKIVLLTGRRVDDDPEREAILLEFARADAMLYKPCDPVRLREAIVRLLETASR